MVIDTKLILAFLALAVSQASSQNSVCPVVAETKIVFMGSSVCFGANGTILTGAYDFYQSWQHNQQGYAFDYASQLNARYKQGIGANWKASNISVGGNSTPLVLARWKKDLLPQCGRYVVYGLSLANEGLMANAAAYDQFRNNMEKLIQNAKDSGMVPVVVNNYPNGDYTPDQYAKIKSMGVLIHQWNAPSVNVLGAVEDGAGHWAPGFFSNAGHPDDKGHLEMASAFVPSLFDALKAGKPRPQKKSAGFVKVKEGDKLSFQPEAGLHSFTYMIDIRTSSLGAQIEFKEGNAYGRITLDSAGLPVYQSAKSTAKWKGKTKLNDGAWHTLAFTHYSPLSKTFLYIDAIRQFEAVGDAIRPTDLAITPGKALDTANLRNLAFYRAGMNQTEMDAMRGGAFLQSSMEIFATLDGQGKPLAAAATNLAQSLNVVAVTNSTTAARARIQGRFALTMGQGGLRINAERAPDRLRLYGLNGTQIRSAEVNSGTMHWNPAGLQRGIYLLEMEYPGNRRFRKIAL